MQHTSKDACDDVVVDFGVCVEQHGRNFLAVVIRAGNVGQVFTVSDTRGNVYRRALQANQSLDAITLGVYYAEGIAGARTR